VLLKLHSSFPLHLGGLLVYVALQFLESFSLQLVLCVRGFLFLGNATNLFKHLFVQVFPLLLDSFVGPLNGVLKLLGKLTDSLFLELELLRLEGFLPLEFDLSLGQFV